MAPYPCAEERRGRGLLALAATPHPRVVKREGRGLVSRRLALRYFFCCAIFCFFFVVLFLRRGCFPVILPFIFSFSCFRVVLSYRASLYNIVLSMLFLGGGCFLVSLVFVSSCLSF